jgi:large subunit ribosomal protein L3
MKVKVFYGLKKDQFQTFDNKGIRLVATSLKTYPAEVKQIKGVKKDGYKAYKIETAKDLTKKNVCLREIKFNDEAELKVGDKVKVGDVFSEGDKVKITGKSKGSGFAGVIKRWGFSGGPRTHGQSDRERAPGSIGQGTDPGRVWKGKKMPGRMGSQTTTIKNLQVFKIDEENNEIWVKGVLPGKRGGLLKITKQ